MKTSFRFISLAAGLALALTSILTTAVGEDKKSLAKDAEVAVQNFTQADPELKKFFAESAAYVILPTVGEGGFIIGGAHGTGSVFEKGVLIGTAKLSVVSVGAQVGGGSFSEVVFFQTPEAFADFKKGNYTMNAQAKANAAASGVAANAKYTQGVLVFTLPKTGAMVSAAIGGQKFTFEPLK